MTTFIIPKLKLVSHKDYIPAEYLPTFNSNVIELWLHKIPELRKALKGSIRFHQMQMLKLQMEHIDFLTKSIEEMDEDIKKKRNP